MKIQAFLEEDFCHGQELARLTKQIQNPSVDSKQVQKIADQVGMILQSGSSIKVNERDWQHMHADEKQNAFHRDALQILEKAAAVEETRMGEDRKFLRELSKLSYEMKDLQLAVDTLAPSQIQEKLEDFKERLQILLAYAAFHEDFFENEMQSLEKILEDLIFCFHFPLQRILDTSIKRDQRKLRSLSAVAKQVFFSERLDPQFLKNRLSKEDFMKLQQEIFKILTSSIEQIDFNDPKIRQIIAIAIMRNVHAQLID